jgi:hypothetical protein
MAQRSIDHVDGGDEQRGDLAPLSQAVNQVARDVRGQPGRPKKGAGARPLSLVQIDQASRDARLGDLTVSRGTIHNWLSGKTVPQPRKLAAMLSQTGRRGKDAVPFLVSIAPHWIQAQAQRFIQEVRPVLEARPGEIIRFRIDTVVHASADVISIGGSSTHRELSEAQRLMVSGTRFGWVTLGPTLIISAPSDPICRLLGIDRHELNGSHLYEDPFLGKLEESLENFGEWLLIIAMLIRQLLNGWREAELIDDIDRAERFFRRVRSYVEQNFSLVSEQIARVPRTIIDDDSREARAVLEQCQLAALERADWPAYIFGGWNSMRLHIARHPLLEPGEIARFVKIARPIPLDDPLGFEVIWEAEDADAIANRLMRASLSQRG